MKRRLMLRGNLRLEVQGAEPSALLNRLTESGLTFWDAEPEDDFVMRVSLSSKDLETAERLAARCQCTVKVLKAGGVPAVRSKLRRRLALMTGLAACFAVLGLSRLFVWEIEVEGNETLTKGEILRALAESGVEPGSFWPSWSSDTIKNEVILKLPELAWLGVSVDSSKAVVRVREREVAPELVDNDAPYSVRARRTGIIESVQVYLGAPMVQPGDAVLEGETLVSGRVESTLGTVRYVHASAKIEARTYYELTAAAQLEQHFTEERGGHTRWALVVGGGRLNLYLGGSELPENSVKETREHKLEWPGVFSLPIALVQEKILEYDVVAESADKEALTERLKQSLSEELDELLDGRGETLSQTYTSGESDGILYVTLRAECLEDIAETWAE